MSRVFVIPDVHLKPWMFEKVSELIAQGEYDHIVMLGDLQEIIKFAETATLDDVDHMKRDKGTTVFRFKFTITGF